MNRIRYSGIVVAIFLALILSAFNVAPVFAGESSPHEVAPTEEVQDVVEEGVSDEGSGVDTTEENSEEETESEASSVAEVIESLPEETDLIVIDEDGEVLPLASEAAAEVIKVADPQWCPVGVTPGAASCSGPKPSFNGPGGLIEWLINESPNKAGVIWIEADYVGTLALEGGPVVLDNNLSISNFALTINGGWTSGKNLDPNTPSTFNVPFNITGWTGAVTINNIVVDSASGAGVVALWVQTKGNIVINNVDVQNTTTDGGASFDNSLGTGSVTVNNSTFNNNQGINATGLTISSTNAVTLKNITAMGNKVRGAFINNNIALTPKPVTLSGTNNFSYNKKDGLFIYTKGAITLSNVTAVGNTEGIGTYLSNDFSDTKPSAVTIKGTNNFSENGWDGLRVYTYGAITISNITANDNGTDPNRTGAYFLGGDINNPYDYDHTAYGKGVYLYNYNWSSSTKPQPVTLTGTNTFNGNTSTGLYIYSTGMVKISNLTANENDCDPLKDLNYYSCAGAYITGAGVTLTGYNFFIGNVKDGLKVYNAYVPSKGSFVGAITLSNLYAEANGGNGVLAINDGSLPYNVTITGTNFFNDNTVGYGLYVESNGVVTVSNITANGNDFDGVFINNTFATTPKAVVITGTNTFNNNKYAGLIIYSYGAITTNNVTANFNNYAGVFLDNCDWDWQDLDDDDNDGDLDDCLAYSPQPITMNGINVANENCNLGVCDGILLFSRGAITINNITVESNTGYGIYMWNAFSNGVGGITQKGYVKASNSSWGSGVFASSNGAIALANVTANNNHLFGAEVENAIYVNPAKPMNITITGFNSFNGNFEGGLQIKSFGAVVLNNLTVIDNGDANIPQNGNGVNIDNTYGIKAMPVTLNGTNTFNGNYGTGLNIFSFGAIKVNNLMASFNEFEGVYLDNQHGLFSSPITLSGYVIANDNGSGGLIMFSNGNVVTNNVTANNNRNNNGVLINNEWNATPSSAVNVTMSGVNFFNGNDISGLMIMTDGAITLSNVTANLNADDGAALQAGKTITLNGSNTFNYNKGDGLFFVANGNVVLNRITANYNNDLVAGFPSSTGIVGTAYGNLTINCGSLSFNEGYGYYLTIGGGKTITLKGVIIFDNPNGNYSSSAPIVTRACPLP